MTVICTYYVSNEREYFSLSNDINNSLINASKLREKVIKKLFYHFYFLNSDFSVNIHVKVMKFCMHVTNIHMKGTVSDF